MYRVLARPPLSSAAVLSATLALLARTPLASAQSEPDNSTLPVGPYGLDNVACQQDFYLVNASSTNFRFVGLDQTQLNQSEATALGLLFSTAPSNFTQTYMNGTFELTQTFNISGTLCTPVQGAKNDSALQLLVHGVAFDSSYWDFEFQPQYSYVRHAASYGYSTFAYDRLGCGLSETPENGYDTVQVPTEVSILTNINKMLRDTTNVGGRQWSKIVGIGHSLGSVQTQAVSHQSPELYDAVILQGFSANSSSMPNFYQALGLSIARDTLNQLSDKPTTWLASATPATNQLGFWFYPFYDSGAFDLARKNEQPVTMGTLTTAGTVVAPAGGFNKPVQFVMGSRDLPFTGGNAYAGLNGQSIPAESATILYPQASAVDIYIPEDTGHAVNQHFSAPYTYEAMINFIAQHDL